MTQFTSLTPDMKVVQLLGISSKNWGWLLALGILFILLGMVGLASAAALTIVSVLFFGWLLFIGGALQLFQAFKLHGFKSVGLQAVIAILYFATGLIIILDPAGGAFALTALIAITLIALGTMRIIMAFAVKGSPGWLWLLFAGIVPTFFGVFIFTDWASSALLIIGLMIAIEMMVAGWSYVMLALLVKRQS